MLRLSRVTADCENQKRFLLGVSDSNRLCYTSRRKSGLEEWTRRMDIDVEILVKMEFTEQWCFPGKAMLKV